MQRIRTEHFIPAPPGAVWKVLTDFAAFHEWNPLNIAAEGEARLGAKVRMRFINPARPGKTVDQTVTVTTFEPERKLGWRGHVPLLFDGRHSFERHAEGEGTRLVHGEEMRGLIPLTFSRARIERDFVPAYERMNRALEARVAEMARKRG